jgi:hypothetical protein
LGGGFAPLAISRLVDEWLDGEWLPRAARIAVGIESRTEGVLVEQHRFSVNQSEEVDYLPYQRPHGASGRR